MKWILAIAMLITLGGTSCKKGCNNPKAYNFSQSAKQDDGSCLFCDSTTYTFNSNSQYVEDYNNNSPYQYQDVLNLTSLGYEVSYSGNGCKLLGKVSDNSSSPCFHVSYSVILRNLTNRTMTYSDNLRYNTSGSGLYYSKYVNVTLPPYGSDTAFLFRDCETNTYISVQSYNPSFVYQ